MDFASETSVAILEYAQKRELETRAFYESCLIAAATPAAKRVLERLIEDEKNHYRIVTRLLENARKQGIPGTIDLQKTEGIRAYLETQFSHRMTEESQAATIRLLDMLDQAVANEKESHHNYATAAIETDNPKAREIYEYLAKQEFNHFVMVDNLRDFLGAPGKWLYEEENLIFRNG